MAGLRKLGKRKVREMLDHPKGMEMDVIIMNPLITVKPNPESEEYLEVDLGHIRVTNIREKNNKRLLDCKVKGDLKETYSEVFNIKMAKMQMRLVKGQAGRTDMTE